MSTKELILNLKQEIPNLSTQTLEELKTLIEESLNFKSKTEEKSDEKVNVSNYWQNIKSKLNPKNNKTLSQKDIDELSYV